MVSVIYALAFRAMALVSGIEIIKDNSLRVLLIAIKQCILASKTFESLLARDWLISLKPEFTVILIDYELT